MGESLLQTYRCREERPSLGNHIVDYDDARRNSCGARGRDGERVVVLPNAGPVCIESSRRLANREDTPNT
jgi:hypothetical protein